MRTEFIEAKDEREVEQLAPWAAVAIEVEGGWMAFESVADAVVWEGQK